MKGRDWFTLAQAAFIKQLLGRVRRAERAEQKALRARIRGLGFYISDFGRGSAGFGPSDFDDLVRNGLITITDGAPFRAERQSEVLPDVIQVCASVLSPAARSSRSS